jgi:hypothetical protein
VWAGALTAARNAPEMEKFATWVMGITGAAFALLIGNLDKIVPLTGSIGTVLVMLLMILSAYFGFVARFQAYQVKIDINLHDDKSLEIGDAYANAGGLMELRTDKIDAGVHKIISPEIEELSSFGKRVWRLADWFIGLPAPKPNLEGLEPEYQGNRVPRGRSASVRSVANVSAICVRHRRVDRAPSPQLALG